MLKLFSGLNILTKMYVSEPANLHIFYVEICRCGMLKEIVFRYSGNPVKIL
jgi:hypothetical protein